MPVGKDKKAKALSALEFRYLAERHQHEAKKMQDRVFGDEGRLFTLAEAATLMGHLSDSETCLAAATQIDEKNAQPTVEEAE